jgi:copper chaperone NosL
MKLNWILGIAALVLWGCSSEPKPIHYNLDVCEFCHMVITDTRYGTEILTDKGKAYKFDSFECLIDYTKEKQPHVGQYLVTDFNNPKELVAAEQTWVIKNEAMPSPMGRYLTVFSSQEAAKQALGTNEGKLLPFKEALAQF